MHVSTDCCFLARRKNNMDFNNILFDFDCHLQIHSIYLR